MASEAPLFAARPLALALAASSLFAAPVRAQQSAPDVPDARGPVAPALLAQAAEPAAAQPAPLPAVEVRAQPATPAQERSQVGGVSDAPLAETPQSITVLRATALRDAGATSLSSAIRSEPSASDFYNTIGYIESVQVRGFQLDNAQNFRRDGIAISNFMPAALENKERIEILKGVSGIQSGVSSPGGLVNYVLKRPTVDPLREVYFGLSERGTALLHGDVGGRVGEQGQIGYRINASLEERRPVPRDARGDRKFLSGFFDMKLPADAKLEAEFEVHHSSQISVPGFGLLDTNGDGVAETLPPPIDPRINLNSQAWSQPFQSRAALGSLRFQQALSQSWLWGARVGVQRIRTNDYLAFPDGCSSGPNYVYPGLCGNYDVDVYDYRSENERRSMQSFDVYARGEFATGGLRHELTTGVVRTRYEERFDPRQAYNWVGTTNVFAPVALPADPVPRDLNTLRNLNTTELYVYDAIRLGEAWSVWVGARHTRLDSASVRTDGSRPVDYEQSFTTPWAAIGWKPWQGGFVYASAGQGVETEAVPNRPSIFANAGEALPALKSRQAEVGLKQVLAGAGLFSAALFEIEKPYADDVPQPDGTVLRVAGAREARHRGLELSWAGRPVRSLWLQAAAMLLDAETVKAVDPAFVGQRTPNTAPASANVSAAWSVPGVPNLDWLNRVGWSASKAVTRDNSVELPSYWQYDTALVWRRRVAGGTVLTWRAGIDNVFDRGYWREAPTTYWGGTYLFAAMPRTFRASVQASF